MLIRHMNNPETVGKFTVLLSLHRFLSASSPAHDNAILFPFLPLVPPIPLLPSSLPSSLSKFEARTP
jgi:hypothetical protein